MERVNKGEKYWYISFCTGYGDNGISVDWDYETCQPIDNMKFAEGNYFNTKEEAESMAKKLRAVFNGAEVIKMPSEEELEMIAELEYPTGTDDYLLDKGIKLAQMAFNSGVKWLKSKIVK